MATIEEFIKERWDMLPDELKVAVACRRLELPYFTNIVEQTGLSKVAVHFGLDHLMDVGSTQESWQKADDRWVLCFRYDDHCTNDYIDKVISGLLA
jgi:hypothetical protein